MTYILLHFRIESIPSPQDFQNNQRKGEGKRLNSQPTRSLETIIPCLERPIFFAEKKKAL